MLLSSNVGSSAAAGSNMGGSAAAGSNVAGRRNQLFVLLMQCPQDSCITELNIIT